MPQSLTQIYVHIVFSTKYRRPLILPAVEVELYQYLTNQCNLAGCIALEAFGKDKRNILKMGQNQVS